MRKTQSHQLFGLSGHPVTGLKLLHSFAYTPTLWYNCKDLKLLSFRGTHNFFLSTVPKFPQKLKVEKLAEFQAVTSSWSQLF